MTYGDRSLNVLGHSTAQKSYLIPPCCLVLTKVAGSSDARTSCLRAFNPDVLVATNAESSVHGLGLLYPAASDWLCPAIFENPEKPAFRLSIRVLGGSTQSQWSCMDVLRIGSAGHGKAKRWPRCSSPMPSSMNRCWGSCCGAEHFAPRRSMTREYAAKA